MGTTETDTLGAPFTAEHCLHSLRKAKFLVAPQETQFQGGSFLAEEARTTCLVRFSRAPTSELIWAESLENALLPKPLRREPARPSAPRPCFEAPRPRAWLTGRRE